MLLARLVLGLQRARAEEVSCSGTNRAPLTDVPPRGVGLTRWRARPARAQGVPPQGAARPRSRPCSPPDAPGSLGRRPSGAATVAFSPATALPPEVSRLWRRRRKSAGRTWRVPLDPEFLSRSRLMFDARRCTWAAPSLALGVRAAGPGGLNKRGDESALLSRERRLSYARVRHGATAKRNWRSRVTPWRHAVDDRFPGWVVCGR